MLSLSLATLFFLGIHLVISGTHLRNRLVNVLGEQAYMGLFSLLSIAGIIWMVMAFRAAPHIELWGQITSYRWLASVLILIAFLFVVLGSLSPNPTAIGGEALLAKQESVRGIVRITRHPFLVGAAIWSITHMIFNGDLAANIFFGGFFILSLVGPFAIDRKQRQASGQDWQAFAEQTSILPFAAIISGRNSLLLKEFLNWRLAVAIVIFIVVFQLHGFLFGVSPLA